MKKASLFCFLLFLTCGGAESDTIVIQDSSDVTVLDSSTTTIHDTTTSSQETTITIEDTTTTSIYKNKCDDCEYLSINELISNINNVPKFAWNDYQRISDENNYFESESFEIILNVGPSTNLYFQDNEKYIQNPCDSFPSLQLLAPFLTLDYKPIIREEFEPAEEAARLKEAEKLQEEEQEREMRQQERQEPRQGCGCGQG